MEQEKAREREKAEAEKQKADAQVGVVSLVIGLGDLGLTMRPGPRDHRGSRVFSCLA